MLEIEVRFFLELSASGLGEREELCMEHKRIGSFVFARI